MFVVHPCNTNVTNESLIARSIVLVCTCTPVIRNTVQSFYNYFNFHSAPSSQLEHTRELLGLPLTQ